MKTKRLSAVCILLILTLLVGLPGGRTIPRSASGRPDRWSQAPVKPLIPEKLVYGTSAAGRELVAWRIGAGKNVMILTFAMHGYEDGFDRDGQLLVDTADRLLETLTVCGEVLVEPGNWTVYILPSLNPDGLLDGWTCDGPGRCTVGRGIDLNRSFPYRFAVCDNARNCSGSQPLSAPEAAALADFTRSVRGRGANILIDVHGWYEQTLVAGGTDNPLFRAFHSYFPDNYHTSLEKGYGYYTAWAAYELGYDACLFEFPPAKDGDAFRAANCDGRFIQTVSFLLRTYTAGT